MQETINSQNMLKVGTILRGTYRIDSYLSSGGFGNTYVATNIEFEERVAIKEFFMKGVTQRDDNQTTVSVSNTENHNSFLEQKEKFKKEARRLRKLKNDHIVAVHDLFEENGTAYYIMDYVDGENLAEHIKRTGRPMTEQEVLGILPQILDALKSVHDAGIWHLDLKPANIMLTKEGIVKLIDFGASKQLNVQKGGATTSTAISYTNGYAPREQMEQNYDKFGPWTDIYALGATLYALLTNKRPPLPTDIDDDNSDDKNKALPFLSNISNTLKKTIIWMMKTSRMERPQNMTELQQSLNLSSYNHSNTTNYNPNIKNDVDNNLDESTLLQGRSNDNSRTGSNNKEEYKRCQRYLNGNIFKKTIEISATIGILALLFDIILNGLSFSSASEDLDYFNVIAYITLAIINLAFILVLIPYILYFKKRSLIITGLLFLIELLLFGKILEAFAGPWGFYGESPHFGIIISYFCVGGIIIKRYATGLKLLGSSLITCSILLLSIYCITSFISIANSIVWFTIWSLPICIEIILMYLLQWFAIRITNQETIDSFTSEFPITLLNKKTAILSIIGISFLSLFLLIYSYYDIQEASKITAEEKTIVKDRRVINYPQYKTTQNGLELEKIIITNTYTRLDFNYVNMYEGGWCSIDKNTYLRASDKVYKMKTRSGIAESPNVTKFSFVGQGMSFSLFFPPIDKSIEKFDFIENDSSSWQMMDIQISSEFYKNRDALIKDIVDNMVYISSGTFKMGNDKWQCSFPSHQVTLSDYYINRYEVTQREWTAIMATNPSTFLNSKNPVDGVTWEETQLFLKRLSKITDKKFRLPTEAEWEYAAQGGGKSKLFVYSGSNTLTNVAWYSGNSNSSTHPVGEKDPNVLGLYDMSGNVWEWCSDYYAEYSAKNTSNPTGPQKGSDKVIKGGSYNEKETLNNEGYSDFWPFSRNSGDKNKAYNNVGFRIVMEK